jgi:thiol-disulfide isomerase/thioredoxin
MIIPDIFLRIGLAGLLLLFGWAAFRLVNLMILKGAGKKSSQLIVYFTTPDCAACKSVQRPALARLQQAAGLDRLQIIEINAYEKPELAKAWGVMSVPTTFILDAHGTPRQVNHGVTPAEKLAAQLQNI